MPANSPAFISWAAAEASRTPSRYKLHRGAYVVGQSLAPSVSISPWWLIFVIMCAQLFHQFSGLGSATERVFGAEDHRRSRRSGSRYCALRGRAFQCLVILTAAFHSLSAEPSPLVPARIR